jgi:predicted DNA-binding transcriptional regulator YafY
LALVERSPVLTAIRERRSIEVYYQSLSKERPKPIWRRMTPHAFGYDAFRWHVRAFCHLDQSNDFLLPRILGVQGMSDPGPGPEKDVLWQETFDVKIAPHPDLTDSQKAFVAKDFGMVGGRAVLRVR